MNYPDVKLFILGLSLPLGQALMRVESLRTGVWVTWSFSFPHLLSLFLAFCRRGNYGGGGLALLSFCSYKTLSYWDRHYVFLWDSSCNPNWEPLAWVVTPSLSSINSFYAGWFSAVECLDQGRNPTCSGQFPTWPISYVVVMCCPWETPALTPPFFSCQRLL